MATIARPRVVLADDHPSMADRLRAVLEPECEVVVVVADGVELLAAVGRLGPDVVVTDVTMPRLDGLEAARAMLSHDPGKRIVLVTAHRDREMAEAALRMGVLGFVSKAAAGEDLVPAVFAALRGQRHVSELD